MRKGVAFLFRYREVSKTANERYLAALAAVEDPTLPLRAIDHLTQRKEVAPGRGLKAFNPLAKEDCEMFEAFLSGEHCIRGFTNSDLRAKLRVPTPESNVADEAKASSRTTRLLRRFRAFGLIAKVPRSRRWRVTKDGRTMMAAALRLRNQDLPRLLEAA